MNKKSRFFLLFLIAWSYACASTLNTQRSIGLFSHRDPTIDCLLYANWGSRPYEYYWASTVIDSRDKKVIDIGMGLPSQSSWHQYVVGTFHPALYVGIDYDGRMLNEQVSTKQYELKFMSAVKIKYPDRYFDIAFAISSLHCMPYQTLMKSIAEIHRVLTDDGLLVITFEERWDHTQPLSHANNWNTLEQDLIKKNLFTPSHKCLGMPEFLVLIQDYFELVNQDAYISDSHDIISKAHGGFYYHRNNKSETVLHSIPLYNSCVSYAVLKKKERTL